MTTPRSATPETHLARLARERFLADLEASLGEMAAAVRENLNALSQKGGNAKDMQERRDAQQVFQKAGPAWVEGVRQGWRKALVAHAVQPAVAADSRGGGPLSLMGDEEVEDKILASRLALAILDKANWELNDLRLRIQRLESTRELDSRDLLKPEVIARVLVEQWVASGMTREAWTLVQDSLRPVLVERLVEAYHHANEFLIHRGVMPEIDLKPLVRRTAGGAAASPAGGRGGATSDAAGAAPGMGSGSRAHGGHAESVRGQATQPGLSTLIGRAAEETRMLTSGTPLARARQRAQGVLGQLKRLLSDRVSDFERTRPAAPSPALAAALREGPESLFMPTEMIGVAGRTGAGAVSDVAYSAVDVDRIAVQLRQRTSTLKEKAGTASEKATIEIVALMFQSILAEERIPASVRVWFARLQMPVLRLALSEPEFFGSLQHPARQLIDRMGSCVMGFDASNINGSKLEAEIRRIVQVVEQYPETGRRVYQLVYDEFQKFLAAYLTEKSVTQRVVSVAQQVEQKETLAVQYTIELRNMLGKMPVRDEVREFLFKVWAEVLAVAAVRQGAQHADTLALKRTATDLLWAASAKPNRNDRARVIQELPKLLQRLRQGMDLLGLSAEAQDAHVKLVSSTLADAFLSKTEAIPQEQIDEMARRLANLEDVVNEDGADAADFPLDADSIEMMLGIDASSLVVVDDGGSQPTQAMLAWAMELETGNWFLLDHNGKTTQVQYVWRSPRRQLHLFASAGGLCYLLQARRLAAYLQAGLIVPSEDETLTVRATREALTRLDANPEMLLH